MEVEGALRQDERAVDKVIGLREKVTPIGVFIETCADLFKCEACVRDDGQAALMYLFGELRESVCLHKRFAARKGDAAEEGILIDRVKNIIDVADIAAVEAVGLWIVAAGAIMGAALGEDGHSNAGAVNDRFSDDARESEIFHNGASGHARLGVESLTAETKISR